MSDFIPFSNLLKNSRKKLRISQGKVCERVGRKLNLTQRTLSAWEKGRQLPDVDKLNKLEPLAKVLEIKFYQLQKTYKTQRMYGGLRPQGLSESELLDDAKEYVASIGAKNLDLWFLGPENLPIRYSAEVEETWLRNIKDGSNYNLVWFLDQINDQAFNDISSKIEDISKRANEQELVGKITNYAMVLMAAEEASLTVNSIKRMYEDLCNTERFSTWVPTFTRDSAKLQHIKGAIIKYWQCTSSIILYSSKSKDIESEAALHLNGFYLDFDEVDSISPFLWYGSEHVTKIKQISEAIQDYAVVDI